MAFRYMNPGYVSLLDSDCTATQVTDSTYSRTGVAFFQTTLSKGITVPNLPMMNELWYRFDFYLPNETSANKILRFGIPAASWTDELYIRMTSNSNVVRVSEYYQNSVYEIGNTYDYPDSIKLGEINKVLVHYIFKSSSSSNSYMEVQINNTQFPNSTLRSITCDLSRRIASIYTSTSLTPISNIIISDQELSIREYTIALPITLTETNMTAGENGLYIANAANQSLLQSVDASALAALHGANSQVTGVALAGNPAYKTAEGLASFTSLSKAGSVVTEHDTFNLSDDTASVIQSGWALSNTTIADLQNMQFGWKAGE